MKAISRLGSGIWVFGILGVCGLPSMLEGRDSKVTISFTGICAMQTSQPGELSPLKVYFPRQYRDESENVKEGHDHIVPHHDAYIRFPAGTFVKHEGSTCSIEPQKIVDSEEEYIVINDLYLTLDNDVLTNSSPDKALGSKFVNMSTDIGPEFGRIANTDAKHVTAILDAGRVILGDPIPDPVCWGFAKVGGEITSAPRPLVQRVAFQKLLPAGKHLHFGTQDKGCNLEFDSKGGDIEIKFGNAPDVEFAKAIPEHWHQDWDTHFELYYRLTEAGAQGNPLPFFAPTCKSEDYGRSKPKDLIEFRTKSYPRGIDCPPAFFTK